MNGKDYYFVVTASNSSGESPKSNELSAKPNPQPPPSAPSLNSASAGDSQVNLNWSSVSGATGYKVKYGTSSGNYTITIDNGYATSRAVSGLNNGTVYYFVVTAYNTGGESGYSNEKVATPQIPPPSSPTLNTAAAGSSQVSLEWSSVSTAAGYKVKYGTAPGSYTTAQDVGNVTNFTVTNLTNGTIYYFVVTAYNAGGESGYSNELSAVSPAASVHLSENSVSPNFINLRSAISSNINYSRCQRDFIRIG